MHSHAQIAVSGTLLSSATSASFAAAKPRDPRSPIVAACKVCTQGFTKLVYEIHNVPKALLKEQKPPLTSVLKVWGDPKTPISLIKEYTLVDYSRTPKIIRNIPQFPYRTLKDPLKQPFKEPLKVYSLIKG